MTARKRNLQATRRSAGYRRALLKAWRHLESFCRRTEHPLPDVALRHVSSIKRLLVDFTQDCYDRQEMVELAKHAILCSQFIRRDLKGKLREAWDSVESWQAEMVLSLRPPLPPLCLWALLGWARLKAFFFLTLNQRATAWK